MVTEQEGVELLAGIFRGAGLEIVESFDFREGGVVVSLDGFDPVARIGFEYITTEAGDREELTPAVLAELELRMRAEELFLFLVDEGDIPDLAALAAAARGFLALLRDRGRLP
ncbi:MAG: hypothetical protein IT376_04985 [Polyangiaceae bacterium]|nr:hypothetical protein [Polyangiaceae bacterium]